MDDLTDPHHISRLEIVVTGRRRRWSAAEKLRIVEESFSAPRLASATARRHGISNQLLFAWRKAYRDGRLGEPIARSFFRTVPTVPVGNLLAIAGRRAISNLHPSHLCSADPGVDR